MSGRLILIETLFWLEESSISGTPVAVTFNYGLVNDFLLEWNKKKIELSTGKITPEEYFEWKIKFPE